MVEPSWRLLAVAAAISALTLAAASSADPNSRVLVLRTQGAALAGAQRAAILDLYSLDSRLAAAQLRLVTLNRTQAVLRAQQKTIETELRLARANAHVAQERLARRLRVLYDHGATSSIDLFFAAGSLADALTNLDNLNRVTSVNGQLLIQLRSARRYELKAKAQLIARQARLAHTIRAANAEARSLAAVRAQRSAYVSQLASRQAMNQQQIANLEAQASAARVKAQTLTPPSTSIAPVAHSVGNAITVQSTGYCLTGTTATGIPVGPGVVAVDPRVIPLGTHLTIPGYGEGVAADTGGAIIGNRIDLWFPSCAQAGGWGWQSVTIALH